MKRLTEDVRAQAAAWLEDGLSQSEIARKIGCSTRTVRRIARENETDDVTTSGEDHDDGAEEYGTEQRDRRSEAKPERTARPDRALVARKTCGALVGVGFLAASVVLTGTARLAATNTERREIGGALSEALWWVPETSRLAKIVNALGPWGGLIDGVAMSIFSRAIYIAKHRVMKAGQSTALSTNGPPSPPFAGPGEIFAPDPSS